MTFSMGAEQAENVADGGKATIWSWLSSILARFVSKMSFGRPVLLYSAYAGPADSQGTRLEMVSGKWEANLSPALSGVFPL